MSAIVCGKRSFFEDLPTTPPVSKRIRCSSSSPVRFSPPRSISVSPSLSQSLASQSSVLDHLRAIFPDMDKQVRLCLSSPPRNSIHLSFIFKMIKFLFYLGFVLDLGCLKSLLIMMIWFQLVS